VERTLLRRLISSAYRCIFFAKLMLLELYKLSCKSCSSEMLWFDPLYTGIRLCVLLKFFMSYAYLLYYSVANSAGYSALTSSSSKSFMFNAKMGSLDVCGANGSDFAHC
jgi:hypothetical protein